MSFFFPLGDLDGVGGKGKCVCVGWLARARHEGTLLHITHSPSPSGSSSLPPPPPSISSWMGEEEETKLSPHYVEHTSKKKRNQVPRPSSLCGCVQGINKWGGEEEEREWEEEEAMGEERRAHRVTTSRQLSLPLPYPSSSICSVPQETHTRAHYIPRASTTVCVCV